jgi:hypothetical protein
MTSTLAYAVPSGFRVLSPPAVLFADGRTLAGGAEKFCQKGWAATDSVSRVYSGTDLREQASRTVGLPHRSADFASLVVSHLWRSPLNHALRRINRTGALLLWVSSASDRIWLL